MANFDQKIIYKKFSAVFFFLRCLVFKTPDPEPDSLEMLDLFWIFPAVLKLSNCTTPGYPRVFTRKYSWVMGLESFKIIDQGGKETEFFRAFQ